MSGSGSDAHIPSTPLHELLLNDEVGVRHSKAASALGGWSLVNMNGNIVKSLEVYQLND